MWLQLSQIKTKLDSPKGTRENSYLFGHVDVTKIRKTRVVIYLSPLIGYL